MPWGNSYVIALTKYGGYLVRGIGLHLFSGDLLEKSVSLVSDIRAVLSKRHLFGEGIANLIEGDLFVTISSSLYDLLAFGFADEPSHRASAPERSKVRDPACNDIASQKTRGFCSNRSGGTHHICVPW